MSSAGTSERLGGGSGEVGGAASSVIADALRQDMTPYRRPSRRRGAVEVLITAAPLALCWGLACLAVHFHFWWGLALVAPATLFLLRLFMIQHDCGHGAFLPDRLANDWLGRVIGVLTLTPYDYWRQAHAIHHATAGNLDRRTLGAVDTLTVAEFQALSPLRRLGYRLYRHPLIMFALGPVFVFVVQHRWPQGLTRAGWRPWVSTMATNLAIALATAAVIWLIGVPAFLMINVPMVLFAAAIGVWLFYVQHQFEETTWARHKDWNQREAALSGSSHYDLPPILRWFTANIGLHHVHHLSSRIPYYRLGEVLRDHPQLATMGRITILDSFRSVPLALWDEQASRLVSFRQARMAAA
jgi:acyl-lipid omega-6 desaturase (Delta-12 desaturase)